MDRLLSVFLTVVDKKNLTLAAEKLYITQSAVSQNLKMLENKFGATLLERTNKRVKLTKAGEILYFHAQQILNQYSIAGRLIDELQEGISGPLYIGSGFTFGEYRLPGIISQFITKYPKIQPYITIKNSNRIANQVKQNDLDIGIIEREITDENILTVPFAEEEMVVIVPTHFLMQDDKMISANELNDKTWIVREEGSGTRRVTDNMFANMGVNPENILIFGSTQVIKEAVKNGVGISYISKLAVQKELREGTLKSLAIKDYTDTRKFFYVINELQPSTKILSMFIDALNSISQG